MEIRTLNTNELLPEYFYVFSSRNSEKLLNQTEAHNIKLRKGMLISSGFSNVLGPDLQREKYIKGELTYLPFVLGKPTTFGPISPFLARITERYTLEYNLETYRMRNHKTFPSRFSGIYAFGDYETCKSLAKNKNWDLETVKRYRLKDMGEFNKYIKVIKTNFNIIGAIEHYGTTYMTAQIMEAIANYWKGTGSITIPGIRIDDDILLPEKKCGTRWEYLIEGVLEEVP